MSNANAEPRAETDAASASEAMQADFDKATQYTFDDKDVDRAKLLLGIDVAHGRRELFAEATPDAIRNWSLGMGDDNPLYVDDHYGATTRWGSQIGPGPMAGQVKTPMYGDPIPDEVKKATKSLFRGIHVFVSGGTWEWFRPVYPGDRLYAFGGEETLDVKQSEFAGKSVIQVRRDVILDQHGSVIGVYRILRVSTERKAARERGKYTKLEPANYTDADMEKIDAIYAQEKPRGREKRYFEDVKVGDKLQPMVKGPLTVTEIIAVHAGGYGFTPYGLRSSRVGYKNRVRIKPFYVKNEHGIPDVAQRLHWDSAWAQAIGNPMAYDYGVMRQCWLYHQVSDWMGDDGFVVRMEDSIRKFNYQGDTQFLSGKVVAKREVDGRHLVDLEMRMINQRDTETAYASATVSLPSRDAGLPPLPNVPIDIQRKAFQMFARHNELADQKRRTPR